MTIPSSVLASCASILRWRSNARRLPRAVLFDPCAGRGEAILGLRWRWAASLSTSPYSFRIRANEIDVERAAALAGALAPGDHTTVGDAFHLSWTGSGASVLWLDPPYGHAVDDKRLEVKFLKRFTPALRPSTGVLLFLVPYQVLAAAAPYLSRHYLLPRAWRMPDPYFDELGQVLLAVRRAPAVLAANRTETTIRCWGDDPQMLDPLPVTVPDPIALDTPDDDLTLRLESFEPGTHPRRPPPWHPSHPPSYRIFESRPRTPAR